MNYKDFNINQRINFKSWRLSAGMKIFPHDIKGSWDFDYIPLAKAMAAEPAVIMKKRAFERYARKRGWL